jgi:chorismate-pyruvate lyase
MNFSCRNIATPVMPERTLTTPTAPALPVFHPLDEFYAQAGQALPPVQQVDGELVPEPHKSLLVHRNDMTPTLEKFYGCAVHLEVLGRRRAEEIYFREVVLRLDGTNQPVEFGAIKINLALFAPAARAQILEERVPLGHIMAEHRIPHVSRPSAYLRLASDKLISGVLGLTGTQMLYGRRNTLLDLQNRPLAEIVEILPPAGEKS